MKPVPISVCIASVIITIFSVYSAWKDPATWFLCLGIVIFVASFIRVAYYLIEGE